MNSASSPAVERAPEQRPDGGPSTWLLRGLRSWERAPIGARLPAVVGWMVSIWLISARHGTGGTRWWATALLWNGGHFVVFGILALLWRAALAGRRVESVLADRVAVTVTVAYAVVDEWHQAHVPGRSSDPWDVCSDASGAVFAVALAAVLRSRLPGRRPTAARWLVPLALAAGTVSVAMATR